MRIQVIICRKCILCDFLNHCDKSAIPETHKKLNTRNMQLYRARKSNGVSFFVNDNNGGGILLNGGGILLIYIINRLYFIFKISSDTTGRLLKFCNTLLSMTHFFAK